MVLVEQFLLMQFRDHPCVVSQEFRVELRPSCSQFPWCSFLYAFLLFSLPCLTFLIWTPWDYFILNILDPSPHLEAYFQGLQILHWQEISYATGWPPNKVWPEKFFTEGTNSAGQMGLPRNLLLSQGWDCLHFLSSRMFRLSWTTDWCVYSFRKKVLVD